MGKIKILRILHRATISGPTHHAAILHNYFNSEEFESKLITGTISKFEVSGNDILDNYNLKYIELPFSKDFNPIKAILSIIQMGKIIIFYKPDIIHTHASMAGVYGRLLGFFFNVPVIIHTYHGHVFHSYFGRIKTSIIITVERIFAKFSTQLIAISDKQAAEISKILNTKKIIVIPLGLNIKKFRLPKKSRYKSNSVIKIGIVARFSPIKNLNYFLQICKSILELSNDFEFYIAGGGEEEDNLRESVENDSSLYNRVKFLGWIEDTISLYHSIDGLMLTSLNEGTPVCLIEAIASQLPVFATNVGGVSDIFDKCDTGTIIPLDNHIKAAQLILEYYMINKINRLPDEVYENCLKFFGEDRLTHELETLYKNLVKCK